MLLPSNSFLQESKRKVACETVATVNSELLFSGLLSESILLDKINHLSIPVIQRAIGVGSLGRFPIANDMHKIALPVTFTPYASVKPCSARCWFCSENLEVNGTAIKAASLRPSINYQQLLASALGELQHIPMGLSLSGLEMTDDAQWLLETLDTLKEWQVTGGEWQEKAGYTNAAGLADKFSRQIIIQGLSDFEFDRIELSRHHFDSVTNQKIMRFRKNEQISEANVFEPVLKLLNNDLPVSLVCIIQKEGVSTLEQIDEYLKWAKNFGVTKVIFRELCDVPAGYKNNRTLREISLARQSIENIVQSWLGKAEARINYFTNGYYFWNANFTYRNTEVIFERSDYAIMNKNHRSDTIHKLVFFANGNLCAGWEPNKAVLYTAG